MKRKTVCLVATMAFIVAFMGCASESRPTRFYTLAPAAVARTDHQMETNVAVAIGPVELPDQLDRPQVVTRVGENELNVSEFHHWAGSLKRSFALTLLENVSSMLGIETVYIHPVRNVTNIDYQVTMEVTRFDGYMGGEATLSVIWTILKGSEKTLLVTEKSVIKESLSGSGYDDLAKAQSKALARLSRSIAEVIRTDARK